MVDLDVQAKIDALKKALKETHDDEEELEKLEAELKKRQEELEKKKESSKDKKRKIDEILDDALKEEGEVFKKTEKQFRRTDIQLQPVQRVEETATPSSENKEEEIVEIVQETKEETPEVTYRRTPQVPTAQDVYRKLETLYESIPQQGSQGGAKQNQRQVYHELKALADHWSTQRVPEQNRSSERSVAYGREIPSNPDNESSSWQRLADRVRQMASEAGPDPHNYLVRTQTVLNRLHDDFRREYHSKDKK